tara:strand:+ start:1265 stop:4714 length:3450 start_codon:yes stop_codon:yes gene_type:complete
MTSITQQIPNYTGGVSQQPDELKLPGQVNKAKNVLPDVTLGLLKRPGGQLIGSGLTVDSGNLKWFHYYRDEGEQYIGQVQLSTGTLRMWKCSDGTEYTQANGKITYEAGKETDIKNYLKTQVDSSGNDVLTGGTIVDSDIQTLTSNDTTFLLNRNKPVAMSSITTAAKSPEAFIELKKVAYANQYSVNLFDNTQLTTRTTATRIEVKRAVDSSNSCRGPTVDSTGDGDDILDRYHATDTSLRGAYPPSGTKPGSGSWTGMCNSKADYNDLTHNTRDSFCPNVDTRIFKVSHGGSIDASDINGVSDTYTVVPASGNAADRKELFFRISTIGQAVPEGGSNTEYICRYTTTHDLLNGGSGWQVGDTVQVWMKNGRYDITIKEISTSKVQANLSLARPEPTPFDTKTVITPESILGSLRTAIFDGGDQMRDEPSNHFDTINQIGNGLYVFRNNHAAYRHVYTHGDGSAGNTSEHTFSIGNFQPALSNTTPGTQIRVYFRSTASNSSYTGKDIDGTEYTKYKVNSETNNGVTTYPSITLTAEADGQGADTALTTGQQIEIFQTNPSLFNISTPSGELLNVITSKVDDVGDLPKQCKHGYVIEVANSEADEDNYYVKFFGNNDKDGDGVWEECPKPGITTTIDPGTMPVKLVRQSDGNFKVSQIAWDARGVGDDITAPEPSFVTGTDGDRKINNMMFFRNRLVFFSDENVIMSRPGEFYNFWPKSAITYSAEDPIDLSASSDLPAIIYDGIQVNSGLILFSENQQFMLSTESEVLSPVTAKINSLTTYNFNSKSNPFSLGATIGFLDNAGKYSRFFEMVNVLREGEPTVLEQSKIVSQYLPKEVDIIANSRENSAIFFAVKGQTKLYGYRYHTAASKRILQSWFEWELSGAIQHLAMLDDALYAIVKNSTTHTIQKFRFKHESAGHLTYNVNAGSTDDPVNLHLDQAKLFNLGAYAGATQVTYNATTNKSSFAKPAEFVNTSNLAVIGVDGSAAVDVGRFSLATINGSNVEIDGDWTQPSQFDRHYVYLGYLYDMEVEFPTIYRQETSGSSTRSDTSSSLVLHRVNLSFGGVGVYDTTLTRVGKLPYQETYESTPADAYKADTAALLTEVIKTIPVYEKNTNLTLTLKSTHPSPATLYSMSWEGDYSPKYYRRV